jgi:hypothetical protein
MIRMSDPTGELLCLSEGRGFDACGTGLANGAEQGDKGESQQASPSPDQSFGVSTPQRGLTGNSGGLIDSTTADLRLRAGDPASIAEGYRVLRGPGTRIPDGMDHHANSSRRIPSA